MKLFVYFTFLFFTPEVFVGGTLSYSHQCQQGGTLAGFPCSCPVSLCVYLLNEMVSGCPARLSHSQLIALMRWKNSPWILFHLSHRGPKLLKNEHTLHVPALPLRQVSAFPRQSSKVLSNQGPITLGCFGWEGTPNSPQPQPQNLPSLTPATHKAPFHQPRSLQPHPAWPWAPRGVSREQKCPSKGQIRICS